MRYQGDLLLGSKTACELVSTIWMGWCKKGGHARVIVVCYLSGLDAYHHAQNCQAVSDPFFRRIETGVSGHDATRYRTLHRSRKIGPNANDTSAIGSRRAVDEARPPPIDEVDLARWVGDMDKMRKMHALSLLPGP